MASHKGLPYMTSAKFSDSLPPSLSVCYDCLSANLGYFFTPFLTPLCGRHIWKPPNMTIIEYAGFSNPQYYLSPIRQCESIWTSLTFFQIPRSFILSNAHCTLASAFITVKIIDEGSRNTFCAKCRLCQTVPSKRVICPTTRKTIEAHLVHFAGHIT